MITRANAHTKFPDQGRRNDKNLGGDKTCGGKTAPSPQLDWNTRVNQCKHLPSAQGVPASPTGLQTFQ